MKNKYILAFDTCFNVCSVALLRGREVVVSKTLKEPNRQAEMLLPLIDLCLNHASLTVQQIDYIALTNGPGTFTGVRIGLACALGLKFAAKLDVRCLSTFEVVWHKEGRPNNCCIVFKAARGRYYLQKFGKGGIRQKPKLVLESDLQNEIEGWNMLGNVEPNILGPEKSELHQHLSTKCCSQAQFMPSAQDVGCTCYDFLANEIHRNSAALGPQTMDENITFSQKELQPLYIGLPDAYG